MNRRSRWIWFFVLAVVGSPLSAQGPAEVPPADPADVESIDAILTAAYDAVSGARGAPRDWDRLRSLFYPGARLIPAGPRQDGRGAAASVMTLDAFIEWAKQLFVESAFYEGEIARRTDRYGSIAHAFSTYESRSAPDDPEPFERGINSFQLFFDGDRWWIVTIFWDAERPGNPIPSVYLEGTP